MTAKLYNVLFLCTGNSARSILAEAILNREGAGRFRAFSAGSHPKGEVHPAALDPAERAGLPTEGYRSKSWDEFAAPGAPELDFVFTVCDNAAGEVCPVWPGQPMTAHWGIEDPAAVEGEDQQRAFWAAYQALQRRISCSLRFRSTASTNSACKTGSGRSARRPTRARRLAEEQLLPKRLAAEGIGSFFLFATVIGSGIMAEALAGGNIAIALLGNTLATGAILFVLITMLGAISGAHFNPAVTLVMAIRGELAWRDACPTSLRNCSAACSARGPRT